jgi:hypothetical protein
MTQQKDGSYYVWPMPKLNDRQPWERIAFYGPMCSGKSWCANYLVNNQGFRKVAFADKLKEIAYQLYGVAGKDGESRTVLQDLGQHLRKIDEDVWIKYALSEIQRIERWGEKMREFENPISIVLDDLRYINEAQALKDNGFKLVLVLVEPEVREERIRTLYPDTPAQALLHDSEQEWLSIAPDAIVESTDYGVTKQLDKLISKIFVG